MKVLSKSYNYSRGCDVWIYAVYVCNMYSINMYRLYALSTDVCLIQKFINVQWHIMLGWVGIPKWHGMLWYGYMRHGMALYGKKTNNNMQ